MRISDWSSDVCSSDLIYSIDRVLARSTEGHEQEYHTFSAFQGDDSASYNLRIRPSALGRGYDHYLSLPYAPQNEPQPLTLSARLTCTHGNLPASLPLGDINEPPANSPPRIAFRNIHRFPPSRPPTFETPRPRPLPYPLNSHPLP